MLFAGHKSRGLACLDALLRSEHEVVGVLAHAGVDGPGTVADAARSASLRVMTFADPNTAAAVAQVRALAPDVMALAGYAPILKERLVRVLPTMAINLHGGKLPEYRGSSPMNWAIMNGETSITLTAIRVSPRIDAGDVLAERTLAVGPDETIAEVQRRADPEFATLLLSTLDALRTGALRPMPQDDQRAVYWPLRFPEDGLVAFDTLTAKQVHDRVRALTLPYPCAFTFFEERKLLLIRSSREPLDHRGEPGRVYRAGSAGLLVCASDRCVWIREATFADGGDDALAAIPRYAMLGTARRWPLA